MSTSTCRLTTRSKLPGANGSCSASASSKRIETPRSAALRRASASIAGGEVDAGDTMAAARELETEKAGAAAGIERVERVPAAEDKIENAVPGGALGRGADAVAEILVEMRRASSPMGGDLLLDRVGLNRGHANIPSFNCI